MKMCTVPPSSLYLSTVIRAVNFGFITTVSVFVASECHSFRRVGALAIERLVATFTWEW